MLAQKSVAIGVPMRSVPGPRRGQSAKYAVAHDLGTEI